MVEIFSRGSVRPALESQFFQVSPWRPDPRVLTPVRASGTGFTVTRAGNLAGALSNLGLVALPGWPGRPQPAPGAARVRDDRGLRRRAVDLRRGRRSRERGRHLVPNTVSAGGTPLAIAGGSGVVIGAPLINAVIVRPPGFFVTFLLAGTVSAQLLEQAATELTEQVTLS